MADISQIKLPNNTKYNINVPLVEGTGTTAGTWLGTLDGLTEYYDGLMILYKISIKGASTTTLNLNSLGAKTCYIYGTTKLANNYPVNSIILLIYSADQNNGCWVCASNYFYTYFNMSVSELTTGTATTGRTVRADYLKQGIEDIIGKNSVELTQAQYDALPDSKLTDGINYFITDAQAGAPLATEIAMSSSDSTTVADKLDYLTDVTTGSGTLDSTYLKAPAEFNNWVKVGRIVELHLTVEVKKTFTNNNIIASGYPPAAVSGRCLGLNTSSNTPMRANIGTNGILTHAYSQTLPAANHIIELHATYIAAN